MRIDEGRFSAIVNRRWPNRRFVDGNPHERERRGGNCRRRCAALSTGIVRGQVVGSANVEYGRSEDLRYFLGSTASFSCLAIRAFTTVFAGILIASPVAGLRPIRALRF